MGKHSPVWEYFGSVQGNPHNFKCKLCRKTVRAKDSSTTNLRSHLKQHHPREHTGMTTSVPSRARGNMDTSDDDGGASTSSVESKPRCNTIIDAFTKNQMYQKNDKTWKHLTDAVTYCIGKDAMPMSTVGNTGFLHLLNTFDRRYTPPSATAMSRTYIPKLYDATRDTVLQELEKIDYFAATSDMWSSHGMTPYMGYTVHFIDKSWNLHHINLGTRFVSDDHTGDTLSDAMSDMLDQWHLNPSKQVCITTDNGSNVIKAVGDLNWEHLPCFGHNLNLGITNSYVQTRHPDIHRRISRAIGVAHGIVAKFNSSWKKKRDLRAQQVKNGKDPKNLISVSTKFKFFHIFVCTSDFRANGFCIYFMH